MPTEVRVYAGFSGLGPVDHTEKTHLRMHRMLQNIRRGKFFKLIVRTDSFIPENVQSPFHLIGVGSLA